jgi:hypothetical protein
MKHYLIPLLFLCFLMQAGAEADSQGGTWFSPDKKIAIKETTFRGPVNFVDTATQKTIYSFTPNLRVLAILWSPDSEWVAIRGDYSRLWAVASALHIVGKKVTAVSLPNVVNDQDSPLSLLPASQMPAINHGYGSGNDPEKWLEGGKLLLTRRGGGNVKNKDGSLDDFWVTYEFLVQCRADGSSKLLLKRLLEVKRSPQ